jgi:hypothetical protein
MSELLDRLKTKYPHYKVITEPDTSCGCKGAGERKIKPSRLWPNGHEMPCLCVCLSDDVPRAELVREFGNAARRIKETL